MSAAFVVAAPFAEPPADTDQLIVRVRGPGVPAAAVALERGLGLASRLSSQGGELFTHVRVMGDGSHVMRLARRLPPAQVEALSRRFQIDPEVIEILPDRIVVPALAPNDPQFASQWALSLADGVNAPGAWDITTGSSNLIIGIIDTGKLNHADLAGRWIGGYDFVGDLTRSNDGDGRDGNASDPGDACAAANSSWHGTAMAGIAAATGNNALGIAGLNWNSKVLPVRAIGACGGYASDVIDAMRWAVGISVPGTPANPDTAEVLNLSLATSGLCDAAWQSAINEVTSAGVPVVVAAGNNGANASNYSPGNCNGVINVTAVDRYGGLPAYANRGSAITVSAPGGTGVISSSAVLTTSDSGAAAPANDSVYKSLEGTSIAAAHVTGVASLMLSVKPILSSVQVREILRTTARGFPSNSVSLGSAAQCNTSLCGVGIVNAFTAVQAAQSFAGRAPQVVAVDRGTVHALGLNTEGTIVEWGTGYPAARTDIGDVQRVAARRGLALALRSDGTVWSLGGTAAAIPSLSGVKDIAAGFDPFGSGGYGLAAKFDGTAWGWGSNASGQLGDGSTTDRAAPVQVLGLDSVNRVSAGSRHSLALRYDATVWAWGYNGSGQLGDGTQISRLTPVQIQGLNGITALAAGNAFSLALKSDGTVWSWGENSAYGQLGDGTIQNRLSPVQVQGLSGVKAIAAATDHALALKEDGSVWAWGNNDTGQLGDGTQISRLAPVQVQGLSGMVAIAAGQYLFQLPGSQAVVRIDYSLAIDSDGVVYAWGSGALGNGGSPSSSATPVTVPGPGGNGILDLDSKDFNPQFNAALGEIRDSNTLIVSAIPNGSAISITGGQYRIDAGAFTSSPGTINAGQTVTLRQTAANVCGTTTTATATIAGTARNFSVTTIACVMTPFSFANQVGVPRSSVRTSNSVTISGIPAPTPISVVGGEYSIGCTSIFVASAGTIGNNQAVCVRQAASANYNTTTTATLTVGALSAAFHVVTAVAPDFATSPQVLAGGYDPSQMGFFSTLATALRTDGTIFQWGTDSPVQRTDIIGVLKLAANKEFGLALRPDGIVWSWGNNTDGRLGRQTASAVDAVARPIPSLSGVVEIAAGGSHGLAVKSDGTVWSWGDNAYGQLTGTTSHIAPAQVQGLSGVKSVAAGRYHSLALKVDGTVWTWGNNQYGGGDNAPVKVEGLTGIIAISAGDLFSLALKNDQTVWEWGTTPVQVPGLAGVRSIAGGWASTYALKTDGTLRGWGTNYGGFGGVPAAENPSLVHVQGLSDVIAMATGYDFSLAVTADGAAYAWGNSTLGYKYLGGHPGPIAVRGVGGNGTLNLDTRASTFTTQIDVPLGESRQSNTIVLFDIANGSSITVIGGEYRIDAGDFTSAAGSVSAGQSLTLRQAAASSCGTTTMMTVTLAGAARSFTLTAAPCVATPPGFMTQANVPLSSVRISNTVTISGIPNATAVSIVGGEYSIGCTATFTAAAGAIDNNQTLCVRRTSSASYNTLTTATLTVGTMSAVFRVLTLAAPGFTANPQVVAGGFSITGGLYNVKAMGLRSDGLVFEWAGNYPIQRGDISGVVKLAGDDGFPGFALALRSDGTVWSWGYNYRGALGRETAAAIEGLTAAPIPTLAGVIDIAAGSYVYGLAVAPDATVRTWGSAYGSPTVQYTPTQVPGLSGVSHVSAGMFALKGDGTVWSVSSTSATQVSGLSGVTAIARGLALKFDETVWTLGDPGALLAPAQVQGLSGVKAIAGSGGHSLALKGDGTVWAWGNNASGQLGDGTNATRLDPVQVQGLGGVIAIAAGGSFSLAIKSDGVVYAWGFGALGDGSTSQSALPIAVPGVGGIGNLNLIVAGLRPDPFAFLPFYGAPLSTTMVSNTVIISGLANGAASPITVSGGEISINSGAFSAAAAFVSNRDNVRVRVLSSSSFETVSSATVIVGGAVGRTSTFYVYTQRDPARPPATPSVSLGESHSVMLNATGEVFAFGYNANGQLGNGTTYSTPLPTVVSGVANMIQVASGANHVLALKRDGNVLAWGYNGGGQLGDGSDQASSAYAVSVSNLSFVKAIAAGRYHSLALKADGTVWAWGLNAEGQIGNGSASVRIPTPVQISLPQAIVSIAAGDRHNLALTGSGFLYAWGANASGQLGDGSTANKTTPVLLSLTNVVSIAACGEHSLAIRADGSAWAWGANGFGQIGDGSTTNRALPVALASLGSGVGIVACGDSHSLAVKSGGALYAWGANGSGQLGDGSNLSRSSPQLVTAPDHVVAISGGGRHSAAINAAGQLFVWGDNYFGQVGNKTGNFNPQAAGLNVLSGATVISTGVSGSASSSGTASFSGSAVIEIAGVSTGYDFGAVTMGTSGSVPGAFRNQATVAIDGIGIGVSGPGFSLANNGCQPTLDPSAQCAFSMVFSPTASGPFSGVLEIGANIDGSPQHRSLLGSGVAPSQPGLKVSATAGQNYLSFAPQSIGSPSAPTSVTITNTGTASLLVSNASITTGAADFSVTSACSSVSPGSDCSLPVFFTPSAADTRSGVLSIVTNAGSQTVALYGTGVGTGFVSSSYALAVSISGSGTVASVPAGIDCGATCSTIFNAGTAVTLSATPASGYLFTGWSGACTGISACHVTMSAAATVTATFSSVTGQLAVRYRLYSPGTFEHLYTTDFNEYSVLPVCCAWQPEGAIYRVFNGPGTFGGVAAVAYYRLYNRFSYQHHWTTDVNEYNALAGLGWTQEGIDGYILPSAVTGAIPLYRLYLNAQGGLHLWTVDQNERNYLVANAGWVDEGIAGYVIPLP